MGVGFMVWIKQFYPLLHKQKESQQFVTVTFNCFIAKYKHVKTKHVLKEGLIDQLDAKLQITVQKWSFWKYFFLFITLAQASLLKLATLKIFGVVFNRFYMDMFELVYYIHSIYMVVSQMKCINKCSRRFRSKEKPTWFP